MSTRTTYFCDAPECHTEIKGYGVTIDISHAHAFFTGVSVKDMHGHHEFHLCKDCHLAALKKVVDKLEGMK